ncbi:MAG: hypothetical protein RJB54_512 [Actinomycetota bacterium]|jgi:hypothetical protein
MAKKISAPQTSTGGKETSWVVIRLTSLEHLSRDKFTVAGQRRIFTDFPSPEGYEVVAQINHQYAYLASSHYALNHGI